MPLTYINETLRIDALTSISISDITPDEDSGAYARRIEFYTDDISAVNRRPVLTVMVYGDQNSLQVQTPTLAF